MTSLYSLVFVLSCFVLLSCITHCETSTHVWKRQSEREQSSIKKYLKRMEDNLTLDFNVFQQIKNRTFNGSSDGQFLEIDGVGKTMEELFQHQQNHIHQLYTLVSGLLERCPTSLKDITSMQNQLRDLREECGQTVDLKQQVQTNGNTTQRVSTISPTTGTRSHPTSEDSSLTPPTTHADDNRPQMTISPTSVPEPSGYVKTLQCQVNGRSFNVVWSRLDDRPMSGKVRTSARYHLSVPDLEYSDGGRYVCTATNNNNTDQERVEPNVKDDNRPQGTISPTSVPEPSGFVKTLQCQVNGRSFSVVLSRLDDRPMSGKVRTSARYQLTVPDLEYSDGGRYVCTATNNNNTDQELVEPTIKVETVCDPRGSLSSSDNTVTGRCRCRSNVNGLYCDSCKADTFYLSENYPYGCIACFCMNVTQACNSTSWNRAQIGVSFTQNPVGVVLTDTFRKTTLEQGLSVNRNSSELTYHGFNSLQDNLYYWSLPQRFLGNKVSAYGGYLRFTVRYRPGLDSGPMATREPIVELSGNNIVLIYRTESDFFPANSKQSFEIPLFEHKWDRLYGGKAVRESMLKALVDLDYILIRATYSESTEESAISNITLDIAENRRTGQDRAHAVEQCICPRGYKGLSCEDCDTGYYRSGDGLILDPCAPCDCNGHSDHCDSKTGVCRNCQHNTKGDNCERCVAGDYGDTLIGSVKHCQKCPCPLTESSNQFSPTCILDTDGQVTCNACPAGHAGRKCETCLPGYTGNPLQPGDYCQPGGVDCECDQRGTVPDTQCDPNTEQCQCKAYVQGKKCNTCVAGYFYLDNINPQGCLSCFCSGVTNQCTSSRYYREQIRPQFNNDGTHNFGLTNRRLSRMIKNGFVVDASRNEITFNNFNDGVQRERESLFFQLPPRFRGNKVSAYNGMLRFTLEYTVAYDAGHTYVDVDVEIISGDKRLYLIFNPSAKPVEPQTYVMRLRESTFRSVDGSSPTRESFLTVLSMIDGILIRATHHTIMGTATLRDISMDIAVPRANGNRRADEVEQCMCMCMCMWTLLRGVCSGVSEG